ncbi:zinc finger protein 346-like isoform X2 [Phalaenopsis equestris]|uniref:zinc finger protein 346-like isoform X2 n=1 Tax=Phalaenopsis equestris TaxID=78828 RepID=UPI0009E24674|nr:zinc finger protein 346-like isoform X2 [Phalaenopsis equestris]
MAQLWTILTQLYAIAGPCVMLLYPLYASVEAIENPSKVDDEQWLAYWIIYSFLTLFEMVAEHLLARMPIWYTVKLMFVTWLVLPQLRGSTFIYNKVVRKQLRQYGYGPHGAQKKAAKEVSNLSSPNKKIKFKIHSNILDLEEKKQKVIEGGVSADAVRVCTVCNVVCNSAKVFAAHLSGEKHALKALGTSYPTMAPKVMAHIKKTSYAKKSAFQTFTCEVCKIDCNGQQTLYTHKMGKKHKANLQNLQEKTTPKPSAASAGHNETANLESLKKKPSGKEGVQVEREKVVQGGDAEESIMICNLCDIACNSKAVYELHVNGRKHLSMIKKQETRV